MVLLQQILFVLVAATAIGLFAKKARQIRRNILLGQNEDFSDNPGARWKNMLLLAFGQKKMFRNPLVAMIHLVIYAGFVIINIEVLEIAIDGLLGTHRVFYQFGGPVYVFLIDAFEVLALGVLAACVIFLCRRNILKLRRFLSHDLDGWPRSDANYILLTEILLMTLFLTMNATDTLLQSRGYGHYGGHTTGDFVISAGAASATQRTWEPFARRPRKKLLVAAHRRHLRLFELSAIFQTSAYPAGFSKRVLCPAGARREVKEHAGHPAGSPVCRSARARPACTRSRRSRPSPAPFWRQGCL